MRKLYFLLLFLCSFVFVKAQVGGYVFSASSGTFTPITGGTSVATSISAADFLGDLRTSVSIPIGFTFNFAGVNYTNVIAASDGFISFNASATSAGGNNLSTSAAARRPLIAPLWDDLDGNSGSGSAKYITTGSAGSRVFTIEWLNWQWQYDATGATISFQVKLYEGTNVIEFIYRRETGTVSFGSASIGLAGVGTGSGNFLSLNGSGAAPTASSTTETTNISTKPATGQVYTFTPPAPCNTPPAQPTGLALTPASTSIGGTFTAASPAADGYLVVRTTGAAPTNPVDGTTYTAGASALGGTIVQAGAATTFNSTGLTGNTSYAYYVFAMNFNCSGGPKYLTASPINATAATCPAAPGSVSTSAITVNSFTLNWAAPAGGTAAPIASYTIEVSTNSAFTAPVTGSPFTAGASDVSLNIPGLNHSTIYYYRVRANTGCNGTFATGNVTTTCLPLNVPYTMPISTVTTPALPVCVTVADANSDGTTWRTFSSTLGVPGFTYPVIAYLYSSTNAANDWLFTQGLNLTAGRTYKLTFKYNNDGTIPADAPDYYPEKLKVMYGTSNTAAGMTNPLADYPTVASVNPQTANIEFTPSTSGVYYIGFQAYSAADQDALVLDDIIVTLVPILDVTPTAFVTPAVNCITNQVTLKATIRNPTAVTLNLATNPVTVTAAITGAGTGNLTGTVNSGTLAAGASMDVTLTPNFDFNASGTYNIAVTTSMTGDEDAANNSLSATVNIAPSPPVPVITPAAPLACAGVPEQLTATSAFAAMSGTIGTGTTPTTGNTTGAALGPNPFQNYYGGAKQQMLFTAAELTALGMVSGSSITAIRFDLGAADNTYALDNFSVKMGHSNAATLTTWESSLTTVRTAASLTPQVGVNTITLSMPFVWNGTSNLVIETSYSNNNGGTSGSIFNTAKYSTTTGQTTLFYRVDNTTATTLANYTGTPSNSYSSRNNTGFDFSGPPSLRWSPVAGLYTDAAATVPYTGGVAATVYAKINAPATYTVTSTSSAGCTSTATVNVGITGPAITGHPSDQAVCAGGTATFSVTATGPSITYQWKKNGNDIPGANSSTLTISNVAAADVGSYTVVIGSTCSSITSNAAALSLAASPAITMQPQSQTGCTGSNVSFSVTATGGGLTYQWRRNGTDIIGANSATYTINGITSSSAGSYDVVVSGTCSPSVTSTAVSLAVDVAPIINTQPQAQTVCAGANATFTVAASGSGLTYQWRRNGADIAGANSSTYTITGVTAASAGNYDVVVSTSCNTSLTSAVAALTVNASPAITTQPQNQAVCAGGTASFTVSATGPGLTYQWRINGNDIPGANSSTYTINNVTTGNTGNYSVVVSGTCSPSVTSSVSTLSLTAAPAISSQPQNQTGCAGANVSFTVAATGAGLTYQWRKGGVDISGANSATYTINGITAASAGTYDVVVSGTCSPSVTSNAVSLTINATPIITTQPQAQTICAGANASFTVAATGSGLTYQWRRNGTDISGANASTYTITGATAASAGNYDVVITTSCNTTITSNIAGLTVNATPAISTQPQNQVVCLGNTAIFTVSATGTGLTYKWRFNGNDIPGANSSTLTINNVSAASTGNYTVVVSGTCTPSVTSGVATLSIDANNTWLGTVDNNWNNAANWCSGVPTSTSNVFIPGSVPFAPSISASADVRDLTVGHGATLTIGAAGNLNIYGNMVISGTLNSSAGTISFRGASAQSVPAITAANIVANGAGGVDLGGAMTVTSALTLTNGHIRLGTHNLVLNAGATGSVASHIITDGSGAVVVNNVTTTVTVPVGPNAASYNPVTIANGQGRNYTVSVATGLTPALFNNAKAINRTWSVTPNTVPASPVTVSLQYADADANASAVPTASMEMGVRTGTGWIVVTPVGGTAPTGSAGARVVSVPVSQFGSMVLANIDGISSSTLPDITRSLLMPNLVQNTTVLRVIASRSTTVSWRITDASGHVVMEFSRQLLPGQNDITLFLGHLANGMYYLNGSTSTDKLPVLRFIRK